MDLKLITINILSDKETIIHDVRIERGIVKTITCDGWVRHTPNNNHSMIIEYSTTDDTGNIHLKNRNNVYALINDIQSGKFPFTTGLLLTHKEFVECVKAVYENIDKHGFTVCENYINSNLKTRLISKI